MEGARGIYEGAKFGAQFGEATAKGWRDVRDGSEARRKPNQKQTENFSSKQCQMLLAVLLLEFMTLFAVSVLFLGCSFEEENAASLNDCLS